MKTFYITPVSKPRQTRSDKWKQRPCVMKYRAFADEVRRQGITIREEYDRITFVIPMPKSWSQKKKDSMLGKPHKQVPDVDNLCKSLMDAIFGNDCRVWDVHIRKIWGVQGMIIVEGME